MGMEAFYDKTVTLFHRFYDAEKEMENWFPTVLDNANLIITKGANVAKSGVSDADTAKLSIDLNNLPKPYVKPKEWERLPVEEKGKCFTISEPEDFFVKGALSGEIVLEENFFEWMKAGFDDVFKVVCVDCYEDIMPHLEVGGK